LISLCETVAEGLVLRRAAAAQHARMPIGSPSSTSCARSRSGRSRANSQQVDRRCGASSAPPSCRAVTGWRPTDTCARWSPGPRCWRHRARSRAFDVGDEHLGQPGDAMTRVDAALAGIRPGRCRHRGMRSTKPLPIGIGVGRWASGAGAAGACVFAETGMDAPGSGTGTRRRRLLCRGQWRRVRPMRRRNIGHRRHLGRRTGFCVDRDGGTGGARQPVGPGCPGPRTTPSSMPASSERAASTGHAHVRPMSRMRSNQDREGRPVLPAAPRRSAASRKLRPAWQPGWSASAGNSVRREATGV
jgi:hypothetical protein